MADVKWIKILTDIFDDEKILLIESLPSADSIIVIWFKLLCLAGKNNNKGVFMLNSRIHYTEEMLATIFRKDVNTVRFAIRTFEQYGMIEVINNVITIPNWDKHQSLDSIEKRRERQKQYMQERRSKQRLLANGESEANCKANCKANVSPLEEEREEEREEEVDINIYSSIINHFNDKAFMNYKVSSKKTKALIKARLNEGFTQKDFIKVIDNKVTEWLNTDMEKYLRPETLFGTKFEGYLNQKGGVKNGGNNGVRSAQQNISKGSGKYSGFTPKECEHELTEEQRKRLETLV